MKTNLCLSTLVVALLSLVACRPNSATEPALRQQPNILFIAIDDLRPELNCYGKTQIQSPHLDQLASQGFVFERAYCNVPVCGASRASILTGLRPTPERFLDYKTKVAEEAPTVLTLPQYFKQNGYKTFSYGKVFHHRNDRIESWTEKPWHPQMDVTEGGSWRDYQVPAHVEMDTDDTPLRGPAYEYAEVTDTTYFDGKIAERAVRQLTQLSQDTRPFFMALGFVKPHLPFNAPQKYWDLYPTNSISLAGVKDYPIGAPVQSHHNFGELRHYQNIPQEGPVSDSTAKQLIRGYYACVSYVDAMIGRVMEGLKEKGLDKNTIVILWGDHGWSLGDHGLWCKHSTFNVAMQTPLLINVPGKKGGQRIKALTEFVDIYPSLVELAGLPLPSHLQGDSFVDLINNPSAKGKEALFCRWKKSDVIKTDRYLYTEWFDAEEKSVARMLYDHQNDPDETINIAEEEAHQALVASLSQRLRQQRQLDR